MSQAPQGKKERPSFADVYMGFAFQIAERSSCHRLNVGTVITSTDYRKVFAVGYNGNASGLHNKCDSDIPGSCGCLHSEENAVINCDTPRHYEKFVFVTHLPCRMCAKRLINLGGVKRIYYAEDYRLRDSIEILAEVGIAVEHLPLKRNPAEQALIRLATEAYQQEVLAGEGNLMADDNQTPDPEWISRKVSEWLQG
ncbi:deaminase [Aestuariirhabdus sp. Z084]|uniref:deoxycytidylate deaminase n=1 Tax=Aestuariirhabdus haliotis TaxID=2918751 RepID=UPI00201B4137|nr:deaminase [Aestuariirhabdus haliotis]MCL6414216.1 deaminase [Aestuariirhabdus haliotis]MCL6418148.1 deaminase [Aestuariirhabdus haliotis]